VSVPNIADVGASPNRVAKLVAGATVLGLLYFGRGFLVPVTLAIFLSLLVAPAIRRLRRLGLGHTVSVAVAVVALIVLLCTLGLTIGSQVVRMADSLPQYEDTIRNKLQTLDTEAEGKLGQANRLMSGLSDSAPPADAASSVDQAPIAGATHPISVEVHQPPLRPVQLMERVFASVWAPLETMGIVIVVLIFILLEHEAVRDRFIRLVGKDDLRATTIAVNDAGDRLSRFFVSQFAVNVCVGLLIWLGLSVIGLAQALLWGTMAALLRFIPYVGVWIAAFCAALLAAAIAPGWSLALLTLGLFLVVELVVAQLVEPQLYGHTTGLSPLSVVIAAIFWSWLWGPIGLVLSTPLTLCLVVAARYLPALNFLEVLLGEMPALTLPENFYQRALAGDDEEIIANARRYLQRKSLSNYCDAVMVPALFLGRADFAERAITKAEQTKVTHTIGTVIHALGEKRKWWKRYPRPTFLDVLNLGQHLREQREAQFGKWQGPLDAPPGTIVLCIGMVKPIGELIAEILVRILREQKVDGRHLAVADVESGGPPDADPRGVSTVCLVGTDPVKEQKQFASAIALLRKELPHARIVAVVVANPFEPRDQPLDDVVGADQTVRSLQEASQLCFEFISAARAAVPA
jgi:predicted PurR-regulated permease PerM